MNEAMQISYDEGDKLKIDSVAQFFTETAVKFIEAMGYYRDEIAAPIDEGSADRMKAIRAALEASWAGTQRAMLEAAFTMRFEPDEVMKQFEIDLAAFTA